VGLILANWRIFGVLAILLVAGAAVGVSRYQLALCEVRYMRLMVEYKGLVSRAEEQNRAVEALEQAAKEAAARARQAREAAAKTVRIAEGKAASLERALSAPRATSECPAGDAVRVVRADLAAQ
jgi:hypothetical protein